MRSLLLRLIVGVALSGSGCTSGFDTESGFAQEDYLCDAESSAEWQAAVDTCRDAFEADESCIGVISFRGQLQGVDVVIMAAAVADYRPAERADQKIKKAGDRPLALVRNPDILAELGAERAERMGSSPGAHPVLIGFALETNDIENHARGKLASKRCDLIVANEAQHGFGGDTNLAHLVSQTGIRSLETMSKDALADQILDAALGIHRAHAQLRATGQ